MKAAGCPVKNTAGANTPGQAEPPTLANGSMAASMAMALFTPRTDQNTKETGKTTKKKVLVQNGVPMEIAMKAYTCKISLMGLGGFFLLQVMNSTENLEKENSMGRELSSGFRSIDMMENGGKV